MLETVDFNRVSHQEAVAIVKLRTRINAIKAEEQNWHRDFAMECFIIGDHIDFLLSQTFINHERKPH